MAKSTRSNKPPKTHKVVCIVGMAQSRNDWCYDGHDTGCEVWGLNRGNFAFGPNTLACFTRWFQIHPFNGMMARYQSMEYLEWLKSCPIPIYMEQAIPSIPSSVSYPFDAVSSCVGSNYFAVNTIGYMIGMALLERFDEIRLYGINMGDQDIGDHYARPAIEYLLGIAVGRGVKVWVPDECSLLKGNLYAQPININLDTIYTLMNSLRSLVERMPFGYERNLVNRMVSSVEEKHLEATKDKARVVPERAVVEGAWDTNAAPAPTLTPTGIYKVSVSKEELEGLNYTAEEIING